MECKVTGDNDHANRWVSDTMVRSGSYNARAACWWTSTSCSSSFLAVTALLQSAMFMDLAILLYSVLLQCKQARSSAGLASHGVASVLQDHDHAPLRRLIMTWLDQADERYGKNVATTDSNHRMKQGQISPLSMPSFPVRSKRLC